MVRLGLWVVRLFRVVGRMVLTGRLGPWVVRLFPVAGPMGRAGVVAVGPVTAWDPAARALLVVALLCRVAVAPTVGR
ncbi:hypothetical protein SAMN05421541_10555 [Actinoplanes philippinensis]|uniref:Uncharacterized protein n=1 Tax=Actinoplanes philippinensis TaxID=35752 RepID=A0A1I2F462_9ACTN|nr:hypothetical protein [Actinoplanes philippinensis]SFE99426.1 hypothetical protein SAMN05421541_10555 [Actinoplanes philippinensis]